MTAKSVKYPGKLGRPITIAAAVGAAALSAPLDDESAIYKWLARREVELLFDLLDHYGIARDDELKWFRLAHKLAAAHVPAFQLRERKLGRPRKDMNIRSLADLLPKPKGKPGRKRKWSDQDYQGLVRGVRELCAARGFRGRGAIRKALTEWISVDARKGNESETKALQRDLPYFQKRYSEGKKKFPELAR